MKIVHTESSCGWGGQELRVVSDIEYANANGHVAILLCDHKSQFKARGSLSSDHIIHGSVGSKNLFCIIDTYMRLKSLKPDIVITHSSTDSWIVGLIGVFTALNYKICRVRHVRTAVKSSIPTKWLYRRAQVIVTTSEDIRTHLIDTLNLMPYKVYNIPTGFAKTFGLAERVKPSYSEISAGSSDVMLGMVSTLRSWKGHEIALRAIRDLPNVNLKIVGDGPQADAIKSLVCQLGLSERVELVGYQKNPLSLIVSLDALLQPSLSSEGVSQSILQAMGLGVPVIASEIGGSNEVVIEGQTGYLCEPGSPESLRRAITRFLQDSQNHKKIVRNAQKLVNEHYCRNSLARTFVEVLESL